MQVVHFQPHTMFMNRVGCSVCVQQCDTELLEWLDPTGPPKHFGWQSEVPELIKVCNSHPYPLFFAFLPI